MLRGSVGRLKYDAHPLLFHPCQLLKFANAVEDCALLRRLLELRASAEAEDEEGFTALDAACRAGANFWPNKTVANLVRN